ncbi:hypothetical protein Q5752_001164 [Cryptotrichosporon argae]
MLIRPLAPLRAGPSFLRQYSAAMAHPATPAVVHWPTRRASTGSRRRTMRERDRELHTHSTRRVDDGGRFIRIVEVSARDGMQNLPPPLVPTDVKVELVGRLLDCGLKHVEVGSFVRGDRVPQMADTPALLPRLPPRPEGATFPVLVPNPRGLENLLALEASEARAGGLTNEIAVFVSATEAFSRANNGASVSTVLAHLPPVFAKARAGAYRVRAYVSCVMTDPYSGLTEPRAVVDVVGRLLDMGAYEVSLGDTTGEGSPASWARLWTALRAAGIGADKIACHDTFSLAVPSILSLLPLGLRTVDASLAGLGGCPYSPGATGNVATEDVVYALHCAGYETGVDLDRLVRTGAWLCGTLGVRSESRVGRAMWARMDKREKETVEAAAGREGEK